MQLDIDPELPHNLNTLGGIKAASVETAKNIASAAKALAPRKTGAYASGITYRQSGSGARVEALDQKSTWVEFGVPSRNQPAQHILRRAAEQLGLAFVRKSK